MSGKFFLTVALVLFPVLISGCVQQKPEKVPVVEVNFSHYVISGQHVVKINSVRKVEVPIEMVKITKSPPFPGIHAYAIYNKGGKVLISPVAYTSISNEGDNITLYIGIEKYDLPEEGTEVIVVVEVWSANSEKLAADKEVFVWK